MTTDVDPLGDIAWLHKFINCTPFGENAPQSDIRRAHVIVESLKAEIDAHHTGIREAAALIESQQAEIAEWRRHVLHADQNAADQVAKAERAEAEAALYRKRLFELGAMSEAPCIFCGYNGEGYFHPDKHPCATEHHALARKDKET